MNGCSGKALGGGKIKLKATTRGFTPRRPEAMEGVAEEEGEGRMTSFDVRDIRPGRLIDCIINMRWGQWVNNAKKHRRMPFDSRNNRVR